MFETDDLKFNYTFVLCRSRKTPSLESSLSAVVSPINHIRLNVETIQVATQKGLAGSMVVCLQNGISAMDGMTQDRGRKRPANRKRRRDIAIVE